MDVLLPDGTRIAYDDAGPRDGPPLVLLHGLGEGAVSWAPVVPRLAEGHRVLALDLRGHGASDWPGAYRLEQMRDDVVGVLDALGLGEVVLVGHSMGGVVAYLVAFAHPERVARLVVEDAPPPWPRGPRALPERPAGDLTFDWAVVAAVAAQVDDPTMRWWRHLPGLAVPLLLVGGGPTSTVPQDRLAEVVRLVPDGTLVTLDAGHDVHEDRPEEFADAVLGWLSRA